MPTINQLSGISQVSGGDLLPVYVSNNGDARKVSITQLLNYFQTVFASPTVSTNLYTPGTGFNITVPTPVSEQQWMLIQPASTLASGTVTLPLNTGVPDGTQVLITTTQEITAFTLALNGAAAGFGFPSSIPAGGAFNVRYYQATNSWYNINAELQYIFQNIIANTINGITVGKGPGTSSFNTAVGELALGANVSSSTNTAMGYNAMKAITTGSGNTAFGAVSLATASTTANNTAFGRGALFPSTGTQNTAFGYNAGGDMTTGSKNTIIGSFSGNGGGLDIRTLSNYVVLSDGDANVRAYWNGADATFNGGLKLDGLLATNAAAATIASAATIAPTKGITIISGTAAVVTITADADVSSTGGTITLIPTGAFTWTTAGNIAVAGTAVVSRALTMTYDSGTTKWYPSYV
jgi:hypothetical protein